jgi:predicted transcriptional regulator
MARASRSKTKLPEFDPSELEDLILTPAVGTGVGSHLLQAQPEKDKSPQSGANGPQALPVEPTTVDMSTVAAIDMSTVDENPATTGDTSPTNGRSPYINDLFAEMPTVVDSEMTTVAVSGLSTVAEPATDPKPATVDMSTVDRLAPISLWLTESGEIVPASRVKRIRLAQDVLSPAEESVYDTLWGVKSAGAFKEERESYRIVQAGYDFLMKRTRLSKKTIQRIVDRLLDKGFIAIEKPADIYQRSSTVYRVFAYRAVLDRQAQKGRFHVAKIGPGFVYVREVVDPRVPGGLNLSTVVKTVPSTAGGFDPSTEPNFAGPTEDEEDLTTVATAATRFRQRREVSPSSSSDSSPPVREPAPSAQNAEAREVGELRTQLERYLGFIDDDATRQLLRQCRLRAADCRLEEIAYFVSHKMRTVNGIHNPVGFILTAVPRHFENQGHRSVRAFLEEEAARRERIWQEEYRYWGSIAQDSEAPAEERARAEEILHSLKRERKPQE